MKITIELSELSRVTQMEIASIISDKNALTKLAEDEAYDVRVAVAERGTFYE